MSLSERNRAVLYQGLSTLVDEEAVAEMMSYFPARDVEEPVTKEFMQAEVSEVRTDFAGLRAAFADLRAEFADLRAEVRVEIAAIRTEFAGLRAEFADLRAEFADLRTYVDVKFSDQETRLRSVIQSQMTRMMWLNITALTAMTGVIVAAIRL